MKKQNGITLIALVITIIVLLILAGITIAMIAGQDSAPQKAVEARNANKVGEAKDAAALLITGYIQDYYNGKYVGNETAAKNATDVGEYINTKLATAVTKGEHTFQVVNGVFKVSDASGSEIVTGTINSNGTITWTGEATNSGNSGNSGGSSTVSPTGITVSNTNNVTSLRVGETANFTATITPSGSTGTIVWSCSPADAVTFSPTTGASTTATGVTSGNVTITASIQGTEIISTGLELTIQTVQTNAEKAATVNSKIGKQVNYTVASYTKPWRVFYADEDYVFIITTDSASLGYSLSGEGKTESYSNASDVFTSRSNTAKGYSNVKYGEKYNSLWKTALGDNASTVTNNNAKAAAYLCDPTKWDNYVSDTAPAGTFAVGGPTLELLVASWNAAYNNRNTVTNPPSTELTSLTSSNVNTVGYDYNKPTELATSVSTQIVPITFNEQNYGLYNSINNSSQGNYGYWIASPSNGTSYKRSIKW